MHKTIMRFKRKANSPTLPLYEIENSKLVKKLSRYLNSMIGYLKDDKKNSERLKMFLEITALRGSEISTIIKAGWASKGMGGRYKSSKLAQFVKNNLVCWWKQKWFILSDEGIGYSNEYD